MTGTRRQAERRETVRRLFQRVDVGVMAVVVRGQETGAPMRALLVDLSATGACIQVSDQDCQVGDELWLAFDFDGTRHRVHARAAWVAALPDIGAVRLGLAFEDMTQEEKSLLARRIVAAKHS